MSEKAFILFSPSYASEAMYHQYACIADRSSIFHAVNLTDPRHVMNLRDYPLFAYHRPLGSSAPDLL
jgi:hypothetical protein